MDLSNIFPRRGACLARRVVVCGGRPRHTPADGGGSLAVWRCGREEKMAGGAKCWPRQDLDFVVAILHGNFRV